MLFKWLNSHAHDYTNLKIQNEMLSTIVNFIIRDTASEILSQPHLQYSIIIDGTQAITGTEQKSICLRYTDHNLIPHEEFFGLYTVLLTTGQNRTKYLLVGSVDKHMMEQQIYLLCYASTQTFTRPAQPLALFVHCGPHCVDLIIQATCAASSVVRDALQWVNELGHLFGRSGKFKTIFCNIATSEHGLFTTLKPLYPT